MNDKFLAILRDEIFQGKLRRRLNFCIYRKKKRDRHRCSIKIHDIRIMLPQTRIFLSSILSLKLQPLYIYTTLATTTITITTTTTTTLLVFKYSGYIAKPKLSASNFQIFTIPSESVCSLRKTQP